MTRGFRTPAGCCPWQSSARSTAVHSTASRGIQASRCLRGRSTARMLLATASSACLSIPCGSSSGSRARLRRRRAALRGPLDSGASSRLQPGDSSSSCTTATSYGGTCRVSEPLSPPASILLALFDSVLCCHFPPKLFRPSLLTPPPSRFPAPLCSLSAGAPTFSPPESSRFFSLLSLSLCPRSFFLLAILFSSLLPLDLARTL